MTSSTRTNFYLAIGLFALSCWGCGDGGLNPTGASDAAAATLDDATLAASGRKKIASTTSGTVVSCPVAGSQCQFAKGLTTCTLTLASQTITGSHDEISGCVVYSPTGSVGGRRTRHYEDSVLVSTVETTLAKGLCGTPYSSTTADQQQILTSQLVSDVCEAL